MRLIHLKQTIDLEALNAMLTPAAGAADSQAALDRIIALNPHVDFRRIEAGTVLVAPDLPGMRDDSAQPVASDAFTQLSATLNAGLKSALQKAGAGVDRLSSEGKTVDATLKLAGVKRALEADPVFKEQVATASARGKAELTAAQTDLKAVEGMAKLIEKELAAMRALIGQ